MKNPLKRTDKEIEEIYNSYVDMVYRISFTYLKNKEDTEDAVQNVFIRFIRNPVEFCSSEHEKAWFIVTASNICKDILKRKYKKDEPLDTLEIEDNSSLGNGVLDEILKLPADLRTAVYLFYYEGYTSEEIGKMTDVKSSTVRNRLHDAREILKIKLGGDFFE